jgi:hypothetical protein
MSAYCFLYKLNAVQYHSGELTLLETFLFWLLETYVIIKSYIKLRQRMGSSGGGGGGGGGCC